MRGSIVAAIYALCALAEVAAAAKGTGGTQPKATSIRTNGRRSKTGGGSGGKAQQQDLQGRSTAQGRKRHKDAISYADGVSRVAKGEASSVGSSAAWDGGASEDEHVDVQRLSKHYDTTDETETDVEDYSEKEDEEQEEDDDYWGDDGGEDEEDAETETDLEDDDEDDEEIVAERWGAQEGGGREDYGDRSRGWLPQQDKRGETDYDRAPRSSARGDRRRPQPRGRMPQASEQSRGTEKGGGVMKSVGSATGKSMKAMVNILQPKSVGLGEILDTWKLEQTIGKPPGSVTRCAATIEFRRDGTVATSFDGRESISDFKFRSHSWPRACTIEFEARAFQGPWDEEPVWKLYKGSFSRKLMDPKIITLDGSIYDVSGKMLWKRKVNSGNFTARRRPSRLSRGGSGAAKDSSGRRRLRDVDGDDEWESGEGRAGTGKEAGQRRRQTSDDKRKSSRGGGSSRSSRGASGGSSGGRRGVNEL